jgi:energy-converting hydrogenase Eha subunit E
MKPIAGSIVILAGAVIIAAGVIGQDVCNAFNRFSKAGEAAMFGGSFLALVGVVATVWGFTREDSPHRMP